MFCQNMLTPTFQKYVSRVNRKNREKSLKGIYFYSLWNLASMEGESGEGYRRNYLADVIFRIDFTKQLDSSDNLRDRFLAGINEVFPKSEKKQGTKFEGQFMKGEIITKQKSWTLHSYFDNEKEKTLYLEPAAVAMTYSSYQRYSEFRDALRLVTSKINDVYGAMMAKRVGLRYINIIKIPEEDPLEWEDFIASDLISTIRFFRNERQLSKLMNKTEINREHYKLDFTFGLFNSEYPNPIARKEFVLDYDCYTEEEQENDEIVGLIDKFHTEIKTLFEASIMDGLRNIMRGADHEA